MRTTRSWAIVFVAACLVTRSGLAPAGEPEPDAELQKAVRAVMERVYRNKTGIVLGLQRDEVRKIAGAAAEMGEEYSLPLAGTAYDSGTSVPGVLQFFVGGPKGARAVTSISVTLLGKYSIDKMERHVEEVGRSLGLNLTQAEDNPRTYFDPLAERDIWVALGDGVVVVEVD